ncbi:type VII toxin-antitoxin system MntA family adenylyltransferase antitoxin [Paratissierella segnis]|jgi:predicted nucleotidyltransferase|uniref:Nucleotidyltransferase domain-containing protein n=1 Tax=Paratissierella segnis TaxID=2763679 RepID=A0A926EV29_9FIRM|nr:nucleotidyltransferase domain-containing protein [Paratissierella segnis]MBC8588818.1 nucleotidyltransferase domain-containing protein [Paratissierella segnis]
MDIINKSKDILIKHENIIFAYIFGSYAQGKIRSDSDIDIAIYLENSIDMETYFEIKISLMEACKREIDLVILNDATPLLKYEIYRNNILLFTRDKTEETNYKVKVLFEYNDINRYLDLSYNKTIERLRKEVENDG